MSYKEQQEYEHIDEEIAALETKIEELDAQILECATQYTKLEELTRQKEEVKVLLSAKEDRWLELNELAEEIAAQT
jgi:ATP-binding cassette subfamily F protein uup